MKYRALTATGDMQFGNSNNEFYINSPEAVAQAVKTRLLLITGEWFLDVTEGTPYDTEVLGTQTQTTYNLAIRERILDTQGVLAIVAYESSVNPITRALEIAATIDTIYGQTTISTVSP